MISKSEIKWVASLHHKKYRKETGCFIAEGQKVIQELIGAGFAIVNLYVTDSNNSSFGNTQHTIISASEMAKLSLLSTPSGALAVFTMRKAAELPFAGLVVALDGVSDPGNLGTIIRLCDWFGAKLVLSEQCVDLYNPKVVQASMGSIGRVAVTYTNLVGFIAKSTLPVIGAFMEGTNIYHTQLPNEAIVVLGNESQGLSQEVAAVIKHRLTIPQFSDHQAVESLNVATATAIILSEFCRA